MMFDHCTWDDDYKQITQKIRSGLLRLAHVSPETYTAVLMQEAEVLAWNLCLQVSLEQTKNC